MNDIRQYYVRSLNKNKDFICTLDGLLFRILKYSLNGNNSDTGPGVYQLGGSRKIELGSVGGGGERGG